MRDPRGTVLVSCLSRACPCRADGAKRVVLSHSNDPAATGGGKRERFGRAEQGVRVCGLLFRVRSSEH